MSETTDATIRGLLAQNESLRRELHGYRMLVSRVLVDGHELLEGSNRNAEEARRRIANADLEAASTERTTVSDAVTRAVSRLREAPSDPLSQAEP